MLVVVRLGGGQVFGIVERVVRLSPIERRFDVGGQLRTQYLGFARPQRHRSGRVADHESLQPLWGSNGVFRAEHSSPRLTEQVITILYSENLKKIVELVEKELDGPEVRALFGQQC